MLYLPLTDTSTANERLQVPLPLHHIRHRDVRLGRFQVQFCEHDRFQSSRRRRFRR